MNDLDKIMDDMTEKMKRDRSLFIKVCVGLSVGMFLVLMVMFLVEEIFFPLIRG